MKKKLYVLCLVVCFMFNMAGVAGASSEASSMSNNIAQKHRLNEIKKNAHDLDDVLTFRVNSALKKEFSRICKENQSSASSELKRYMLKIVEQGSL